MLTLKWVMREPRPDDSTEGPVMTSDTIVRQAAQAALASAHPVRVVDDGAAGRHRRRRRDPPGRRGRGGRDGMSATLATPARRPASRGAAAAAARAAVAAAGGPGRWSCSASGSWSGRSRRARTRSRCRCREHTDLHRAFTEFRDAVLASRDTNPFIQFTYELGEWLRRRRRVAAADDLDPRLPAPGAADRLARGHRDRDLDRARRRRLADRDPGRPRRSSPSGSSATGRTRWTC